MADLTEQQTLYLEYLFDTESPDTFGKPAASAKKAGYKGLPPMTDALNKAIIDRSGYLMSVYAPASVQALTDIITGNPEAALKGAHALKAATEILDRVGLAKQERMRVEGVENSLVFLPAKKKLEDAS